jgi:hypothetical protein
VPGKSWIELNSAGRIRQADVRPEDVGGLGEIIAAAGGLPTPVPQAELVVSGVTISLPSGMRIIDHRPGVGPVETDRRITFLAYSDPGEVSRLYIDIESGAVLKNEVLSQHSSVFQPVIDALATISE